MNDMPGVHVECERTEGSSGIVYGGDGYFARFTGLTIEWNC